MKKTLVIVITASLGLVLKAEETNQNQHPVSITLSSAVADKYLFPATGFALSHNPVVQTDLLLTHKSGFYVDLWNSRSLRGKWDDGSLGNEIDYGIGWNGTLKDLTAHVGVTYFDEPGAFVFGSGDILYSHARIGKDFKHLTITVGYENYVTMPESGFQGGHLISLTASKNFSFLKDKVSLATSLAGVYDTGTLGSEREFFVRGNVGINWNASKHITLNLISANYFIRRASDVSVASGFTLNF